MRFVARRLLAAAVESDMQQKAQASSQLAGSLVGAGGVTAYNAYHSNDWGVMRTLQWWIDKGNADTARANTPELARLEDMVQLLMLTLEQAAVYLACLLDAVRPYCRWAG